MKTVSERHDSAAFVSGDWHSRSTIPSNHRSTRRGGAPLLGCAYPSFEGYLQDQGLCYVAVDETRRSLLGSAPIKSLDFIVLGDAHLVIDVKGRRFPAGSRERPRRVWESWS